MQRRTNQNESESLTPSQFVDAHAKWGDEFVQIDWEHGKEASGLTYILCNQNQVG